MAKKHITTLAFLLLLLCKYNTTSMCAVQYNPYCNLTNQEKKKKKTKKTEKENPSLQFNINLFPIIS
jgi:hypothetical protein